jgi:hypothetical protein
MCLTSDSLSIQTSPTNKRNGQLAIIWGMRCGGVNELTERVRGQEMGEMMSRHAVHTFVTKLVSPLPSRTVGTKQRDIIRARKYLHELNSTLSSINIRVIGIMQLPWFLRTFKILRAMKLCFYLMVTVSRLPNNINRSGSHKSSIVINGLLLS